MRELAPFTYTSDGDVLICGDGPELLVYAATDGSPRWKLFGDDLIVGVGQAAGQLVALDAAGTLTTFRAIDGRQDRRVPVPGGPRFMTVADTGAVAAVVEDGLQLLPPGGAPRAIPVPGAAVAAFGPGGASLGVGSADGTFYALDPASGAAWGRIPLGAPISGVGWSARGQWVVAAGQRWCLVAGDGSAIVQELGALDAAAGSVAVSADGLVAAVVDGHNVVRVVELYAYKPAGTITFRRAVGGVSFGPGAMLGIGLDDGDAMRIDLFSQQMIRTEPHPGRGRNAWNVAVELDGAVLRGALANMQVGGAEIAEYTGPKPPEPTPWWQWALGLAGGCAVLILGTGLLLAVTTWALYMRGLI